MNLPTMLFLKQLVAKHGIVNGCNTVVRDIIDSITETSGSQTKEYLSVLLAIQSAYANLLIL